MLVHSGFLLSRYSCLLTFMETCIYKILTCSGTQLLPYPVECPCPERYRPRPMVQPPHFATTWARVSKGWPLGFYSQSCSHKLLHNYDYTSSDAFICHIYTLHRRAAKICHSDIVLTLFVGLLCSARAASHQAAKMAVWLSHWSLFWACEYKRWQFLDW